MAGHKGPSHSRRYHEASSTAASFQESLSDSGASRLPALEAVDRLLRAVKGDPAVGLAEGSVWRALCALHWRVTAEVTPRTGAACGRLFWTARVLRRALVLPLVHL